MKSNSSWLLDIGEVQHRLEVWRKTRRLGQRIPEPLWAAAAVLAGAHGVGDLHRSGSLWGHLLSRGQLALPGPDHRARQGRLDPAAQPLAQAVVGISVTAGLSPPAGGSGA